MHLSAKPAARLDFLMRVVKDDDVDRGQVYRQRCHSRALLIARNFRIVKLYYPDVFKVLKRDSFYSSSCVSIVNRYRGGYSSGVPPLPIPNREVKPGRADGTAQAGE